MKNSGNNYQLFCIVVKHGLLTGLGEEYTKLQMSENKVPKKNEVSNV
jgi:hypothetical protein